MKLTALLAAAALALAPTAAFAGFVIIDVPTGPEVMTRAPVAATEGTPGSFSVGPIPETYISPGPATNDAALQVNQCWFNPAKTVKTAGTQDGEGRCIVQGTMSSQTRRGGTPGTPGSPYVPGLYETPYFGIEIPDGDHSWDHVHQREE